MGRPRRWTRQFAARAQLQAGAARCSPPCERRGQRRRRLAKAGRGANLEPMKFTPAFLDEIRARLPVSEVVGKRVKLRRQGREWAGLSPFNVEKTPSFFVNDQKGFFHDFSSGKHGDIFAFLIETEGLSFPDAVERLASMAGVPMPRQSGAEAEQETKRGTLLDALAMAARIFEANLQQPIGAKARGYLVGSRAWTRGAAALFARLLLARALCAARRAGRPGRRRRSDDRGGAAYSRRGDRRALRPVPRPGDVPDPRSRRPGRRLRRAGDGAGREGEISQFPRDFALPQGRAALQSSSRPARPPTSAARSLSSRAISMRSR